VQIATGQSATNGSATELSSGDSWKGIRLEQRRVGAAEYPERKLTRHSVGLFLSGATLLEAYLPGQSRATWRLGPGSVNIMPAEIPFAARMAGAAKKIQLEIDPDFFNSVTHNDASSERLQLRAAFGAEDLFISQLLLALRDEAQAGYPGGNLYGESLGTALAAYLVRKYSARHQDLRQHRGGLPMNRLRSVTEYIEDNLETHLALVDLANTLGMNLFHFARSFKQSTGLPPHQYVLRKRIERAKSLLVEQELSIAEVALRCGFGSQSNFTTAFRRLTNVTPGAYRNACT
jgi:AraC family transcriptional regulator